LEGTGFCTIAEVEVTGCLIEQPLNGNNLQNVSANPTTTPSFDLQTIFPNPANQEAFVKIDSKNDAVMTMEIYNLLGNLQQQTTVNLESGNNTISLDIQELQAGIYHLFLRDEKGQAKSIRFVKINE